MRGGRGLKRKRGHSLIELMFASALMGICLLGVLALVKAGNRYLLVTQAKTDLQRGALIMIRRLNDEFSETNDAAYKVSRKNEVPVCPTCGPGTSNNVDGVLFASPRSAVTGDIAYDAEGRMYWPKWICYYKRTDDPGPRVVRVVTSVETPQPFPPSPVLVGAFLSVPLPYKVMCKNVTSFHCVSAASTLTVHLRLDLPSGYGRKYGFEIRTQVFTRN